MSITKSKVNTIEGYAAKKAHSPLEQIYFDGSLLRERDIEVEITHCGICHSDLHLINNDWNNSIFPLVPGHEIIGIVKQKGTQVQEFELGQRVGIGWQRDSCDRCEWCAQGEQNLCFKQEATCIGHPGGFAKTIITPGQFAFPIPENLSSENAAPLLCGGATVFSPFLQWNVNATWRIGVIGIGGLGHLAIQFARAFGCEVFAFSSSSDKEREAKAFGAHHFISSSDKKSLQKAENGLDLLLFTSSAESDFNAFLPLLRPKGVFCLLGAPQGGHIDLPIFNLIMGRKVVCGSNIGSPAAIRKMLRFAALHGIVAQTELFPMHDVNLALDKLAKNQIHYRAVLCN